MTTNREAAFIEGRRITLIGMAVNVALIALKLAAGLMGRSQALIADAVHSASDLLTDVVVLVGLKFGGRAPDRDHPFGHARLETLASSFVGLALIGAAVLIGLDAVGSIRDHTESRPGILALTAAALSILSKELLYRYTVATGRRIRSQAVLANAWHHRSDAFSSVAVFIGVGAAMIKPEWHVLDAYAALLVSLLVFKVGLDVWWGTIREFTDTAPGLEVIDRITACARGVEGVREVHDLKVRSSGGRYQMEVHIVVSGHMTVIQGHRIAKDVEQCLLSDVEGADNVIVHVDPAEEE